MPNRFYNNSIDLLPFTRARSMDVENHFFAVSSAFDKVQGELDATLRLPFGETPAVLPGPEARGLTYLGFDAAGNVQLRKELPKVITTAEVTGLSALLDTYTLKSEFNTALAGYAPRSELNTRLAGYLPLTGGNMTGPINANGIDFGSGYLGTAAVNSSGPRMGQMNRATGSAVLQLGGPDNNSGFELIDRNWTTVILGASMNGFTYKGNPVWHSGNINPLHNVTGALPNHDANAKAVIAGFTYNNNAGGITGPLLSVGHPDYLLQMVGNYNTGTDFLVRTRNGDGNAWNPWRRLWHDGNLNAAAIMYDRGASTEDGAVAPGYYRLDVGGYSRALLSYNTGGSTGIMQIMSEYQGRIWWRNKTDNANWTGWKEFYHTGNFNPANFATQRLQLYDGNAALTRGSDYSPRFETPWGWVEIGPKNGTACHIYSDSPKFYFNRSIATAGRLYGNGDGGTGLGTITVTNWGPGSGAEGDWWIVY